MTDTLPKLLYIGDVPVENSYHGSALLYRLLEDYPAGRLMIYECGQHSDPSRRLVAAEYRHKAYPLTRLRNSRFSRMHASFLVRYISYQAAKTTQAISRFQPDAILTVGHGYSWMLADQVAKRLNIPLHFIVHDDVPELIHLHASVKRLYQHRFRNAYRDAKSRLCVSPYMVDAYKQRYGAEGAVLYPGRSKQVSEIPYRTPSNTKNSKLRFAYAGTLNSSGAVQCLNELDSALTCHGVDSEIQLYGPFTEGQARTSGFSSDRAVFGGLIPAQEIVNRLQESADVLFLPLSFSGNDRANMKVHFPSKMTDYTATGLPILVYGPIDASGIMWTRDRIGSTLTATHRSELPAALTALECVEQRTLLGRRAFEIGRQEFDHAVSFRVLRSSLG
ncbi:glycosyltransferase [Allorhodopirellula heiligendammensis]|uniref:Glycosyltransferase subfamily 4-like N-terminal domain-containing protein n=1 Tax=Allorhodopirellula heiligendammensis TaxID=2714739 RepID=A0A5C6BYH5_9BACT|nr:glycosyltransferase [Allorhodopirellula heiligendammensis]TWU16985.1 hypothetical protein Poly21_41940 [Allorhodopirellula heiligendammensis]